ncbi:hypothetical protein [Nannocystis bainbridge]|uniref:Uncharacterized protein n=1 Tax=Nannocystis bainbridge TaxID=2995303 RepID=A0ABT5DRB9_9BACT|nr:hypothetical protein [Nannocystis bainbridge]MDC0716204.1 hypothetical protein [Nannocystis bainbridge]
MNKIKLITRGGFDGQTPVTEKPVFKLVEGWNEAELTAPAGVLPAGLWGQVPAGDPYMLHACILTTQPLDPQTFLEVRTGAPTQIRAQYTPSADNTRLTLVRPSDELRVFTPPQALVKLELLIESIGGVNELGSRLREWSEAVFRARDTGVRVARFTASAALPGWLGTLHVIYDSVNVGTITLPTRSIVPLDAVLTVTRKGPGMPTLHAAAGDLFAGGAIAQAIQRSGIIMNNGEQWTWVAD